MDHLKSELKAYRRQSNGHSVRGLRTQKEQRSQRAEYALRESKEELEAIFNQVRDGIIVLDLTGKIIKINKRITDNTGYTEEDLLGKRFNHLRMFTPQSIAKMLFNFSKSLAGIEILPYEVEGHSKNGERRIAEISGALLRKNGKAAGVVTVMRDITERKQAEEALRESEERFRKVVETMKVGLAGTDENGILTYVNEYSSSMIGYSVDEMIGRDPTDFYYDEEERKAQKEIFEKRKKGMRDAPTHEIAWRTKDGRKVYSILSPTPIFDAQGRYKGSFAIHTEITERKRIEEALRESEEKYRELINGMNDTAWVIDFEGNFIDVNNAAVEVLGYSREALLSMGPHDIDNTLDAEEIRELIKEMPTDKIQVFETTHTAKDGKVIPVEIKSSLVTYQGKRAILSIARDITQRKQAEEALQESERKWRSLYENLPGGSFIVNDHYIIEDVNDILCTLTGFTREELVGQLCNIICPKGPHKCPIFDVGKERIDNDETAVKTKEGQFVPIIKSVRRICMGAKKGVVENFQDITEIVRAEEAVRQSEERFRALYEDNPSMYFMVDAQGTVLSVNPFGAEQLGYAVEELIGQSVLKVFDPNDREAAQQQMMACLERPGEVGYWELRKVRQDGSMLWVREAARSVQGADGRPVVLIVCEDITEHKHAEENLRESFERLRRSLESTVGALASTVEMRDPYTAGHQQRVADLACRIAEEMGLSDEQIHGIRFAGLIHDIGKINVPAEILNKPGELNEIEYSFFKQHPQIGYDVLKTIEFPWPVAQIVLQHHERMDGSGYPQGLSGADIIMEARILAVADIVEAIASHRPYRPARGTGDALEEILHNKGILYDAEVVDACLRVFYERGFRFEEFVKRPTEL
jgi:PAS domain S-box-containing protein/putative nucleotidyltransferase with HDIG domain